MYKDGNSTCSRRILAPILLPSKRALTYCNGPHARRVWTPVRVACMHHVLRELWIWVDELPSFPVPEGACLSHCSLHLLSQLLSVLLCTMPLGLTAMSNSTRQSGNQEWACPLLVFSFAPRRLACHGLPAVDCRLVPPPTQLEPFFKHCRATTKTKSLRPWHQWYLCSRSVWMDIQNKPPVASTAISENRTRLSCATNLDITRLISQARDMKPAVGSPSSVLSSSVFYRAILGARLYQLANYLYFVLFKVLHRIPTTPTRSGRSAGDATSRQKHTSVLAVPPGHGRTCKTRNSRRRHDITIPGASSPRTSDMES